VERGVAFRCTIPSTGPGVWMTESRARGDDAPQPGMASRQDHSDTRREIQRLVTLALPPLRHAALEGLEIWRRLRGARHVVELFHQVDDPYSELAIQSIVELQRRYDVDFRFHLVGPADRLHTPEPEMLADYARRDCGLVAPHYGLAFASDARRPTPEAVRRVQALLAGLTEDTRFLPVALEAGRALWSGDDDALSRLAERIPTAADTEIDRAIHAGNRLRQQRGHYSGAMFWLSGEWYWGVDRLHHLERRLIRYGAARAQSPKPRFDRPAIDPGTIRNDGRLSLEIFPSLRSPYTAMIFDRSLEMAARVGLPVTLRPVMPMVMRGVPAPAAKGVYIMLDALREAEHIGAPFGNMFDPIGRPVERGFSLWPWASVQGRGAAYLSAFLRAAFVEGRNTGTDEGLRYVARQAGLDFEKARAYLDESGDQTPGQEEWREELEANRRAMYEELGVWGVPSYRLRGPEGEPDLCVWGQDRLWLVAAEIRRRLAMLETGS